MRLFVVGFCSIRTLKACLPTILGLLVSATSGLVHAVNDSLRSDVEHYKSVWFNPSAFIRNPAAVFAMPFQSLREVGSEIYFSKAPHSFYDIQEGNAANGVRLHSESFSAKGRHVYFGSAGFETGKRENTRWNNVEDFQLLSPYLVADSIGGDFYRETYRMEGGFTTLNPHFHWGLRAKYSGGVSFRQSDPRPLNTVSVLGLQPGIVFHSSEWRWGLSGQYSRYRQNVNISVERVNHLVFLYIMQGFGHYNPFFSDFISHFNRIYKGNKYQINALVHRQKPQQNTTLQVGFHTHDMAVHESDRRIPFRIRLHQWQMLFNHHMQWGERKHFFDVDTEWIQKIGNETLYIPTPIQVSQTRWDVLTQSDRYQLVSFRSTGSMVLAPANPLRFSMWQQARVTYFNEAQSYFTPNEKQQISYMLIEGRWGAKLPLSVGTLSTHVAASYRWVVQSLLLTEVQNILHRELVYPNFVFRSNDFASIGMQVAYRQPLLEHTVMQWALEANSLFFEKAWGGLFCNIRLSVLF